MLGFAILVFVAGYVVRPDTVSGNRIGFSIFLDIQGCHSLDAWLSLDFPSKVYAAISFIIPFDLSSIAAWDALIAFAGGAILLITLSFFTGKENYTAVQAALVLAATALCGVYIFILNKDFLQFLVFLAAFGIIVSKLRFRSKMVLCVSLFVLEFIFWRQYYVIVAVFLPALYFVLRFVRTKTCSAKTGLITFVALSLLGMLVFSFALWIVSPENYVAVVGKHGVEREEFTAVVAASGIASLIDVTPSSPPYLFVMNWLVNTTRILFPVELFLKGPYYSVFAVYQLCISVFAFRALNRAKRDDRESLLVLALYFSFVLASGTFEPDFGSWVRHETACLPILLLIVSISRSGQLSPLIRAKEKGWRVYG